MDRTVAPDWETLHLLADRLGIGLLRRGAQGLVAANGAMAVLAAEFGLAGFAVTEAGEVRLRDGRGRRRRFRVALFDGAWLVQEERGRAGAAALPEARIYPLLRVDGRGRVREANAAAAEMIAWLDPAAGRLGEALAAARGAGERTVDLELDGRIFEFALLPEGDGFLLFGREATERRFAEASLRQDEARLRSLLEAAPDAIVTVSNDGRIDYLNPRGAQMFGYAPEALAEASIELLVPDWFAAPAVLAVQGGEGPLCTVLAPGAPLQGRRGDGTLFPLELSASALDREGQLYVTAIIRDVTEREAQARRIVELNQHLQTHVAQLTSLNAELEAFSYSVSHDLRGPLRSIDGFSGLLLEEYGERLDGEGRDFLLRVRAAAGRMSDLIDGLLRLSRITRGELRRERVDLSGIARFVAEGLQREEPQRAVEFRIEEGIVADCDRALVTVALENLLGNAWKFTTGRSPAHIAFGAEMQEGRRVFFVRDDGAGFDMAYAGKLFLPFERLHANSEYPGTGIGLATVQRVVRRHGGTIWARGAPEQGAVFRFTLE